MGFEIFNKEIAVLEEAKALLESGKLGKGVEAEHFSGLADAYEKLLKSTRRLVRMSDRNEAELNKLAKDLDEKNRMLEGLSSKLAKYLSPQVYKSIFSGEQDVVLKTERKKLTVFFSDIKNFTLTTEDLQPEDLTGLLNQYFSDMSKIALEHGATIDKFIGDAMLMFFGDPETKGVEEDARACVRMAIAMQRRMVDLQDEWRARGYERPLEMRIGINTGYCNVGNFGSDDRMDYTIIGGEVNLAARLEANADPNGVLMSYETYALVQDIVEAEERESIVAKGIRREVRAFAVMDVLRDLDDERRFIRKECDGMTLTVDLEKMSDEARKQAINDMLAVIQRLNG